MEPVWEFHQVVSNLRGMEGGVVPVEVKKTWWPWNIAPITVREFQDHDKSCGRVGRESRSVVARQNGGYALDFPTTNGAGLR
jgi:hypothetical protein